MKVNGVGQIQRPRHTYFSSTPTADMRRHGVGSNLGWRDSVLSQLDDVRHASLMTRQRYLEPGRIPLLNKMDERC